MTSLESAEAVLLVAGAALILVGVAALSLRRRWGDVLRLPRPPAHSLEPTDLLIGLLALWALPGMLLLLLGALGGSAAATQPASAPAEEMLPTVGQVLAHALGRSSAAVLLLWLGKLRMDGGLAGWGLRSRRPATHVMFAAVAYVAVWPLCTGLLTVTRLAMRWMDPSYPLPEHVAIRTLHAEDVSVAIRAMTVISACVLAPIVEELFFRGLLQPALARWWRAPWLAVVASGLAFGLFHIPIYDTIPTLAFFGIVLGYTYAKTRSLIPAMVLHAVFNAKTVLWIVVGS